ncbi:hypothetical protein B0J17DRAFT_773387 [Rhizoctonia solani]|nr:hypothetical protein B0J17DRAFT_773387 [Rhizoctonia solani]
MMPSARTPPDSSRYLPLREGTSPPPEIHVPIGGPSHGSAPLTPEPQPMSQASVDEMHRVQDAELTAHEQANPDFRPRERRHIQPMSHRRTGSAPDPWSPGYQRNTQRFSLGAASKAPTAISGNSKPSHPRSAPLYAHHRHGSASPDAPVRIRRKSPGLMNFFRKLNGERVRERGHKVPGVWQSLKATVLSSWLNILFVFLPFSWIAALAKWNYAERVRAERASAGVMFRSTGELVSGNASFKHVQGRDVGRGTAEAMPCQGAKRLGDKIRLDRDNRSAAAQQITVRTRAINVGNPAEIASSSAE